MKLASEESEPGRLARGVEVRVRLLYHFCRLRFPLIQMSPARFQEHVERACDRARSQQQRTADASPLSWPAFLDVLNAPDLFLATGCLDGDSTAWAELFASRANRPDALLIDALRSRAARLYPRDSQRQEEAVREFWGFLLAGEREGATPILARYDGLRPLVPWLIRVFQNRHLSELRRGAPVLPLGHEEDSDFGVPAWQERPDQHWHEAFCAAVREWLTTCEPGDLLLLGLRVRYRMSQREVARLLGIHEGNVSRQTGRLRDQFVERIRVQMQSQGWTNDDLDGLILTEMESLLLEEPQLAAVRLAALLAARGRPVPEELAAGPGELEGEPGE
jgi:RNA polymerase sigma factor (sigma-70 family)